MKYEEHEGPEVYYFETATTCYEKALSLSLVNRRAAAQAALIEAKYWLFKCPSVSLFDLTNKITNLEKQIY